MPLQPALDNGKVLAAKDAARKIREPVMKETEYLELSTD